MSTSKFLSTVVFVIVVLILGFTLATRNYRECRRAEFSRLYCASVHFVR